MSDSRFANTFSQHRGDESPFIKTSEFKNNTCIVKIHVTTNRSWKVSDQIEDINPSVYTTSIDDRYKGKQIGPVPMGNKTITSPIG